MTIFGDLYYLGVNDREIDLFEGQFPVPNGMSYNSYLLEDERIAVLDTVDARFTQTWLEGLSARLGERLPDYLIISHMEPDHSAGIADFVRRYPETTVVASARAFGLMKNYFGADFAPKSLTVGDGDELCLGAHRLRFVSAPMVHWPEVIMTYDATSQLLFSADAFGKFGTADADEPWAEEARRYYFGIVAKFGAQVQKVLAKLSGLPLRAICPLHGPVLTQELSRYLEFYDTWSSYRPESGAVCIAYTSVYGNTRRAVQALAQALERRGVPCTSIDLARTDASYAVAEAFRCDRLVLATTTYNGGIFPPMHAFIHHLTERSFSGRRVALVENGSWTPLAAKVMQELLSPCRDLTFAQTRVRILAALTREDMAAIDALAEELSR